MGAIMGDRGLRRLSRRLGGLVRMRFPGGAVGKCEGRGSLEGAGGFAEMLWETGGCCRCWGRLGEAVWYTARG